MRSESATASTVVGSAEVRPEELRELVGRLQDRPERTTVGDVAETLGVPPEEVATQLRAMRGTPPVVARPRRSVVPVAAVLCALLLGGGTFGLARARARAADEASTMVTLAGQEAVDRLEKRLPRGATVRVGTVVVTGRGGSRATEAQVADAIYGVMAWETSEHPNDPYFDSATEAKMANAVAWGDFGTLGTINVSALGGGARRTFVIPSICGYRGAVLAGAIRESQKAVAGSLAKIVRRGTP